MDKTKILIIDSDVEAAETYRKSLEHAGYEVTLLRAGREGVERIRTVRPDLIILEAMLPDINGFSVCRELKEDPGYSSIPIIIVTALGTSEETYLANMAEEHKADGFFAKPVDTGRLLKKAADLLAGGPPEAKGVKTRAKILLIDDDPDFLDATQQILAANRFEVITAKDGQEGIARAKYESPDLILLDVIMPGKDGYSVCYELRKMAQTRPIPVIMLTAVGQQLSKPEYAVDMAIDHLADDYIDKPVDTQTLIGKIEKHLRH
ncbi:MAG: response regulator [candidate division WOR-3 bacterium]|nr:MAG: response regulator [candidate division WOR-3 bacterium]